MLDAIGYLSGGVPAEFLHNPNDMLTAIPHRPIMKWVDVEICNAKLILSLPVGVTLKKAVKVLPIVSGLDLSALSDRQIVISMGNVEKDKPQSVLFELLINRHLTGLFRIAQAQLYYDVPIMGITGECLYNNIIVTFTNNTDQIMQINAHVTDFIKKAKWEGYFTDITIRPNT